MAGSWNDVKLVILLLSFLAVTAEKRPWSSPQYGTVAYPKDPSVSSLVRKGDVFTDGENFYRALVSGDIDDWPEGFQFPAQGESITDAWKQINIGSYVFPYELDVVDELELGAIYRDGEGGYFRATCSGRKMKSCLRKLDEKSEWMTLLRPEIGDTPLGDLVLPATHDSGTWGCDEDSYLVNQNALFQAAEVVTPMTLANWSLTQDSDFTDQLEAGFREYDMRIADCESFNDTFFWHHSITGDEIFEGLDQIADFANAHPEEIIILTFEHFASPGNPTNPTFPIRDERLDEIAEILLEKLGSRMAYQSLLSDNPTMNEVLDTGANIICIMNNAHIRGQDDRFWTDIVVSAWPGRTNTEDLFEERSGKLRSHLQDNPDRITSISVCVTPDEITVTAGLIRVYGEHDYELIEEIIEILAPGLTDGDPDQMSFEGMFVDLLNLAREGTNNDGMFVRLPEYYTNGASIHFVGNNNMLKHWIARPSLYKVNIVNTDDFESSTFVDTAIVANSGEILREVAVAYQGSTRHGFYEWENYTAIGGDEGHGCTTVQARYEVTSDEFLLPETHVDLEDSEQVTFLEGQYPEDAVFTLEVSTPESDWYVLTAHNIQVMIDTNLDLYLRSAAHDEYTGFAYVSLDYDVLTEGCETVPDGGYLDLVTW